MKPKRLITAFAIIFIIITANPGLLHTQDRAVSGKSCLWKVSGGKGELYLLGSIHFLKKDNYPLPAAMEKAFSGANTVVFEMDMDSAGSADQQMLLLGKGMYPHGRTLSKQIARDTYALTKKSLDSLGLPIGQMEKFKPWFISLTMMSLKLQMSGFDPRYGVDRYFLAKARQAGTRIVGLETLEEQIDLFDGLPEQDQEMLLVRTINELETMDSEVRGLVNAWSRGDADVLESMIMKSYRNHQSLYERLMLQRNRKWLVRIEEFLNKGDRYVIIVGAGHLVGRGGIIDELNRKGYSIAQQ